MYVSMCMYVLLDLVVRYHSEGLQGIVELPLRLPRAVVVQHVRIGH